MSARPQRPGLEVTDRFRPRTPRRFLERVVRAALAHLDRSALAVSLLLTDDAEIARLHAEWLGDPTPTDVLSFALDDGVEVVLSVERARRVARRHGHPIRAEIALYLVHGILHACGYDDVGGDERARMRDAEREILRRIGLHVTPVDG